MVKAPIQSPTPPPTSSSSPSNNILNMNNDSLQYGLENDDDETTIDEINFSDDDNVMRRDILLHQMYIRDQNCSRDQQQNYLVDEQQNYRDQQQAGVVLHRDIQTQTSCSFDDSDSCTDDNIIQNNNNDNDNGKSPLTDSTTSSIETGQNDESISEIVTADINDVSTPIPGDSADTDENSETDNRKITIIKEEIEYDDDNSDNIKKNNTEPIICEECGEAMYSDDDCSYEPENEIIEHENETIVIENNENSDNCSANYNVNPPEIVIQPTIETETENIIKNNNNNNNNNFYENYEYYADNVVYTTNDSVVELVNNYQDYNEINDNVAYFPYKSCIEQEQTAVKIPRTKKRHQQQQQQLSKSIILPTIGSTSAQQQQASIVPTAIVNPCPSVLQTNVSGPVILTSSAGGHSSQIVLGIPSTITVPLPPPPSQTSASIPPPKAQPTQPTLLPTQQNPTQIPQSLCPTPLHSQSSHGHTIHKTHNVAIAGPKQNVAVTGQQQQQQPPTHIFPVHVISIPQPPHNSGTATGLTNAWPIIEAPIFIDANGERFCPAHPQGPPPQPPTVVHAQRQQQQPPPQQQQQSQQQAREHRVLLQVDAGCTLPLQIGGKRKILRGPTTVQMVSQNRPPPIPVPVQVPQGQVMQQYVNENGTLTHVVLSPTQYQQLHAGQGGVPHIHAPFITTNGTTSHFYGPLTTGYPGPGGGPQHYHPIPGSHLQPPQIPHSPSPPTNYHNKDEQRTTRNNQHKKPMKFEKQREINSTKSTPAHSPRKTDINGLRRTSRNGASSVGTSEDGEESSSVPDDEDDCQTIIDQLSAVQKPEVTEITSRSAMLRWEAPPSNPESIINNRDLRYDVLLSDRGKEGKYKIIFKGESYSCMIQDLRPGQEYFVCLQVHYEKIQGSASEPTVFITPPCEPDQPLPPDLNSRTKNSLQLRWRPPCDNGSHVNLYILEYDDGKGKGFVEAVKTKNKQYTLTKLQPSTRYSFRLSAVNDCGSSLHSDLVHYSTTVNPPTIPKPPQLQTASSNSFRLAWDRRSNDEKFTLQMAERECGHGFLSMYNGPDTIYECVNLKRATVYQFRLRATNDAGFSPWSNEVTYKTQPERPGRPSKPQIKGKIHGNYFKAKWDPPNDRGGAEIRKYFLEISSGAKFERVYSGQEPETMCDRLSPGTTYQIRVACEGPSGTSNYSDICTVTTEAIIPGAPEPPYFDNSPGPYAAVLKWYAPDYNGGAPVLEYEVKLTGLPNYNDDIIYRGKDMYCICKNLLPGEEYEANVRAVNRIGAGLWSDTMKFNAGAAPPNPPEQLDIQIRSATQLTVAWNEPKSNGAPISEYRLESSLTNESNSNYTICYQGIQTTIDLRDLIPYTLYYFRVNASNYAGCSQYSTIVQQKTPAACPGIPQITKSEITASELTLNWSEPESNGSKILYYRIEYSERTPCSIEISTKENVNEFTIKNLASETSYKFKIQAVNDIGAGQWSVPLKLTTLPPPPEPPILECTGVGPNFIRLKWGEGKNLDFTKYYVEMYNNRGKIYQEIYRGNGYMCKVYKLHKLQEQTEYIFRICAETDRAGTGEWSSEYRFKTSATLPSSIKQLKITPETTTTTTDLSTNNNNNNNSHNNTGILIGSNTIEWQPSKNSFNDPVEYILQCSNGKETDYRQIHRGRDTKYTIENLEPGSIYLFRVCPIRCTSNDDIYGTFTTPVRYQVPLYKLSSTLLSSNTATTINNTTLLNTDNYDGNTNGNNNGNSGGLSSITATVYNNTNRIPNLLHRITGNHITSNNYTNNSNNNSINSSLTGSIIDKNHINSNIINGQHNNQQQQLQQLQQQQQLNYYDLTNNIKENTTYNTGGNNNRISGAIKRFIDKIYSLYSSRKRFTDTQKAILWTFSLLLLTFIFAALLSMFMR